MEIKFKKKKFEIELKKSSGIRGLMFRRREKSRALLLEDTGAIHSLFVFFPFVCLWLDNQNRVLEHKVVMPFSLHEKPNKKFNKIVEIPINQRYHSIVSFVVGKTFKNN